MSDRDTSARSLPILPRAGVSVLLALGAFLVACGPPALPVSDLALPAARTGTEVALRSFLSYGVNDGLGYAVLEITPERIALSGHELAPLEGGLPFSVLLDAQGTSMPALETALKGLVEANLAASQDGRRPWTSAAAPEAEMRRLLLRADRAIPDGTISLVLFTASRAGFSELYVEVAAAPDWASPPRRPGPRDQSVAPPMLTMALNPGSLKLAAAGAAGVRREPPPVALGGGTLDGDQIDHERLTRALDRAALDLEHSPPVALQTQPDVPLDLVVELRDVLTGMGLPCTFRAMTGFATPRVAAGDDAAVRMLERSLVELQERGLDKPIEAAANRSPSAKIRVLGLTPGSGESGIRPLVPQAPCSVAVAPL